VARVIQLFVPKVEHVQRERTCGEHVTEEMMIGLAADQPLGRVRIAGRHRREPPIIVGDRRAPPFALADDSVLTDERLELRPSDRRQKSPDAAAPVEHTAAVRARVALEARFHEVRPAVGATKTRQPHGQAFRNTMRK
jgi:hypothetical protein